MKSKRAKEIIDHKTDLVGHSLLSVEAAVEAVEVAEQELCDKFAEDIHRIVETWDKSDKKLDGIYSKEVSYLQAENEQLRSEIATLRTALEEANKRCEIAQKVIADKNAKRGEGAAERNGAMTLNYYQQQAMETCLPSSANDCYMLFGLVEEVGELCGKVSKAIRKKQIFTDDNEIWFYGEDIKKEFYEQIKSEISDILWFVAGLCRQFGWTLEDVAQYNLDKLAARKQSNTIVSHTDH